MAIDFKVNDIIHRIAARFHDAFLPDAKKPFYLKAVYQPELDIHGIASKADVYNITTSPKVIEDGLNAGMELMYYLAADGFKLKTPLFNLKIRLPGEYSGSETSMAEGTFPIARLQVSASFRKYLKEKVKVDFIGVHNNSGLISGAKDEATGLVDEVATIGNILTIHGNGLKIEGDETDMHHVGVYFTPNYGEPVKASIIAVNEPRTLKVIVPSHLTEGTAYTLTVETRCSGHSRGSLLKNIRHVSSDFTLTAQGPANPVSEVKAAKPKQASKGNQQ